MEHAGWSIFSTDDWYSMEKDGSLILIPMEFIIAVDRHRILDWIPSLLRT